MSIDDTQTFQISVHGSENLIRNSNGNHWEAIAENIQAAINDLTDGGTVWLPSVEFVFTYIPYVNSNINLIGTGNGTIFKLGDYQEKNILNINGQHILISNIAFDGNMENNPGAGPFVNAIHIDGNYITIKDCSFKNGCGHMIQSNGDHVIVDSCNFDTIAPIIGHYSGAIWFRGSYCIAKNNFIKDTWAGGIIFEHQEIGDPATHCIADGNEITGYISYGIYMEGKGWADDCMMVSNFIHDIYSPAHEAINGMQVTGILVLSNSICSDNRIENVTEGIGIEASGQVTISNNIIKNIDWDGIHHHSGDMTATGNIIENTGRVPPTWAPYGIGGGDGGVNIAANNIIKNPGYYGIRKCEVITGNYIYDATIGISRGYAIVGNYIQNCATGIVPSSGAQMAANYLENSG